ncbi:MAG: hypothetical protein IIC69_03380 [Nanoarchaeota archaeon]|nr:hypothetical protein [Nanoarchaeota archaeon]
MPFTKAELERKIKHCDEQYEYFLGHANWHKEKKKEYKLWLRLLKERLDND